MRTHLFYVPIVLLMLVVLNTCNKNTNDQTLQMNEFNIVKSPAALPDEVPSFYRYPDSTLKLKSVYESVNYILLPEGVVMMESRDPFDKVGSYYEKVMSSKDWKIIQTSNSKQGNERLIMAESPYNRLVTVIIRGADPVNIKLYFRKVGGD